MIGKSAKDINKSSHFPFLAPLPPVHLRTDHHWFENDNSSLSSIFFGPARTSCTPFDFRPPTLGQDFSLSSPSPTPPGSPAYPRHRLHLCHPRHLRHPATPVNPITPFTHVNSVTPVIPCYTTATSCYTPVTSCYTPVTPC